MGANRVQASTLSRLFSAQVFRDFGRHGKSPLFSRLVGQSGLEEQLLPGGTVADAFDAAFSLLRRAGWRDEYVYRSALTQKILLGRHSLNTATILNELRAGNSKADVVVLNGTASVYEIKSERDTLQRLTGQLNDYMRVFASVNVVVSPAHVGPVLALAPADVGVLVLTDRYTLRSERLAQERPERIDPMLVLDSLRVGEALQVLSQFGIEVLDVPNTRIRAALRSHFLDLDPAATHAAMVATLRRTRSKSGLADFVRSVPNSLTAAALSVKVSQADQGRIRSAIDTPLKAALTWS